MEAAGEITTTHTVQTGRPGERLALQTNTVLVVLLGRRYSIVTGSHHLLLDSPMGFHQDRAREAQGVGLKEEGEDLRHGTDRVITMTALPAVEAVAATAAVRGGRMNRGRSHHYQMRRRPAEVEIGAAAGGRTIGRCHRARRRIGGDIKRNIPTNLTV